MDGFVVVTGLPASGKSTLAKALSANLSIPLIDKDAFLEALFENQQAQNLKTRGTLSRLADDGFRTNACSVKSAILVSWWKHPHSHGGSGTPTEWLAGLPGSHTEVHCKCSPTLAAQRFLARKRHPGHFDQRWTYPELLDSFEQQALLGPLGLGHLIEVDTSGQAETANQIGRVVQAITRNGC
jgi:shikimate kinase